MAAGIFTYAFVFHTAIEKHKGIPPVPYSEKISKSDLLDTWEEILAINYWPIFSIARDLVEHLPVRAVPLVIGRDFLPANEAYRDPTRIDLDRLLLVDVSGLDGGRLESLDLLRRQWCAEPSVHGGKGTRIKTEN